jgi:hypothetical protein
VARLISFAITTDQIKNRTKTVTRRVGWKKQDPGVVLYGVVKAMGFPKGSSGNIEYLDQVLPLSITREPLYKLVQDEEYGKAEAFKEGFPELDGFGFVDMFTRDMKCSNNAAVTRIEFGYPLTLEERDAWLKTVNGGAWYTRAPKKCNRNGYLFDGYRCKYCSVISCSPAAVPETCPNCGKG